jgi:hypothetical protein
MKQIMPQEIEVWYLIPALRRELARIFIKNHGLNQKKAAEILGITEAAISQYFNSKRGNEIKFSRNEIEKIEKSAEEILRNPKKVMKELYDLCVELRETKVICDLHRNRDKSVPKNCDVCFR